MNIPQNLTIEERVNFLTENREEIKMEIYFATGIRDDEGRREIMTIMLREIKRDDFYSVYLNSFEGVSLDRFIETCEHGMESGVSESEGNHIQAMDEMIQKSRIAQRPSSMR